MEHEKGKLRSNKQKNGGVFRVEEAVEIHTVNPESSEGVVDRVKQKMIDDNGNRSLTEYEDATFQDGCNMKKNMRDSFEDSGGQSKPSKRRMKEPHRLDESSPHTPGYLSSTSTTPQLNTTFTDNQGSRKSSENLKTFDSGVIFKCFFCRIQKKKHVSSVEADFKRHLLEKHALTMYSCSVCQFESLRSAAILKHIRQHSCAKSPTKCDRPSKLSLDKGGTDYCCKLCDVKCADESELIEHEKLHTSSEGKNDEEYCNGIEEIEDEKSDSYDDSCDDGEFSCELCNFRCATQSDLTEHRTSYHGDEKPFGCFMCDMTFHTAIELKDHIGSHSVGRDYNCELCDFKCTSENDMIVHFRTHIVEWYTCDDCEYCTDKLSDLIRHEKGTHTGEKLYMCNECDFKCETANSLLEHVESQHEDCCTMCDFKSTEKIVLTKHMVEEHNRELELLFS